MSRLLVGTFMTALDMAGFSLSLLQLDAARIAALDAPTQVLMASCQRHARVAY